jgi:hypothetical protein
MTPSAKATASETFFLWAHRVLMPILTLLIAAVISIMGFVGNQIWAEARAWMREFDGRVARLEISEARTDGNRFSSNDWAVAKARLDEDRANMDRRVTRLEEAVPVIKESLLRIETKLDKIKQ